MLTDEQKTLLSEIITDEFERSCDTTGYLPDEDKPGHLDHIKSIMELRLALEKVDFVRKPDEPSQINV